MPANPAEVVHPDEQGAQGAAANTAASPSIQEQPGVNEGQPSGVDEAEEGAGRVMGEASGGGEKNDVGRESADADEKESVQESRVCLLA
jgi:hypothetical protein